jgi:predicted dehydrogenase
MSERDGAEMAKNNSPVRVLVVGLGTMGRSHARAYRAIDGFSLVGLCTNRAASRDDLAKEFPDTPLR